MRVLGIDPGTQRTGWGVVERRGTRMQHHGHGLIQPPTDAAIEERLLVIFEGLSAVLVQYEPDAVAVEDVFHGRHAASALKLGQARGVALAAAARAGLAVAAYPPARVKRMITGYGGADKLQVAKMIAAYLGLPEPPRADAADALAIALCHAGVLASVRP
jgi:crossover junction endodeoxyribonuclease RuvC